MVTLPMHRPFDRSQYRAVPNASPDAPKRPSDISEQATSGRSLTVISPFGDTYIGLIDERAASGRSLTVIRRLRLPLARSQKASVPSSLDASTKRPSGVIATQDTLPRRRLDSVRTCLPVATS